MSLREFTDRTGRLWRVWSTIPARPDTLSSDLRRGWLTFESDGERRRLAPIPAGWRTADHVRLELYLRAGEALGLPARSH